MHMPTPAIARAGSVHPVPNPPHAAGTNEHCLRNMAPTDTLLPSHPYPLWPPSTHKAYLQIGIIGRIIALRNLSAPTTIFLIVVIR